MLSQLSPQYYDILNQVINLKGIFMELIGQKFGKWTIISDAGRDAKSNKLAKCKCDCGNEKINRLYILTSSKSTQCKTCHANKLNEVENPIGKTFGKWNVLYRVANKNDNARYLCKCECGREKEVDGYRLRNSESKACPNCRIKTHGKSYTNTFKIWSDLFQRCYNSNHKSYHRYGGRGIIVCERWKIFENFLQDMGERPEGLQIDRTNNDGNYEPNNCRWVTAKENHSNRNILKIKKEK